MGSNNGFVCFLLFATVATLASSAHISNDVFQPRESVGRALLQEKIPCSVDFESMNYTIITSRCKGPTYAKETCCASFTEFACPVAEQINDLKTNCADTMFSHINLYGKYPPGLFANQCRGNKEGLACSGEKSGVVSVKPTRFSTTIVATGLVSAYLRLTSQRFYL